MSASLSTLQTVTMPHSSRQKLCTQICVDWSTNINTNMVRYRLQRTSVSSWNVKRNMQCIRTSRSDTLVFVVNGNGKVKRKERKLKTSRQCDISKILQADRQPFEWHLDDQNVQPICSVCLYLLSSLFSWLFIPVKSQWTSRWLFHFQFVHRKYQYITLRCPSVLHISRWYCVIDNVLVH